MATNVFASGIILWCFISLLQIHSGDAQLLPGVTPCHISDPEFRTCLKNTAQYAFTASKANLANGRPPFDPLPLKDVVGKGKPSLQFDLFNISISGLSDTKVLDLDLNQNERTIILRTVSTSEMNSDYKMDGKLLTLPVTGEGKSYVKLVETQFNYTMKYEVAQGPQGKDYWKIVEHEVTYSPELVKFEFSNLFNGDKVLADEVAEFANTNWREIFDDVAAPIMTEMTNTIAGFITVYFSGLPLVDFLLE